MQLQRNPLPEPIIKVSDLIRDIKLEDINLEHFEIIGYLHHNKINAPMAV